MTAREVYVDADVDLHKSIYSWLKINKLVWHDVPDFKILGDTNPSEIKTSCVIKTNPDLAKDIFISLKNNVEWLKRPSNSYLSPNVFYLWRRDIASCIYDPINFHSALKDYVTNKEPNKNEYLQNLFVKINDNIPYLTRGEDPDSLTSKALGSLITRKFIDFIHKTEPFLARFDDGVNIIHTLSDIFAYLKRKSEMNQSEWINFKYLVEYLNVGFALLVENPQLLDKYTKSSEWWNYKSVTEWLNNLKTVDEVIVQFLEEPLSYPRFNFNPSSPVLFRLLPGETVVNLFLSFWSEAYADAETVDFFKTVLSKNYIRSRYRREAVDIYKNIDCLSVDRFRTKQGRVFNLLEMINKSPISKEKWESMIRLSLVHIFIDEFLYLVGLGLYKPDLSEFINCEHMYGLQISYEKLNGTSLALKGNFEALIYLDLSHNQLTLIQDAFDLPKLERLDLSSNQLETINTAIFQKSKKLTKLLLNNNKLRTNSGNPFDFKHLPNLKYLELSSNKLTRFNAESFINMDKAPKLELLDLKNNQITEFALDIKMMELSKIFLFKNPLNSTDFDGLRKFAPGLKILILGENAFSKEYREMLTQFQKNNQWPKRLLFFDRQQLTDIGLITSLSIEDDVTDFPHLRSLKWDWIPIFAVLTGINGVGKTKLLIEKRLLEYQETLDKKKFARTFGLSIAPIFPLYLKLHDKIEITKWKSGMWQEKISYRPSTFNSLISLSSIDSTIDFLSDDLDQVNKHLSDSKKFKHSIIENPAYGNTNMSHRFLFQRIPTQGIPLEALSPGEHIILILLLWEYVFSKYNQSGRVILLLDEVDSHLHPSAVEKIIAILKKLATEGIQIIMTSHSPTTVAMVEKENLFHLCEKDDKGSLQVISYRNATNKDDLILSLTDEVVRVTERMRLVLTEGGGKKQDDHLFYTNVIEKCGAILKMFSVNGKVNNRVPVVFRRAGNSHLAQLFDKTIISIEDPKCKFNSEDLLFGIVDGDFNILDAHVLFQTNKQDKIAEESRKFTNNLFRLERYNLENYLHDPINFFFLGVFLSQYDKFKENLRKQIKTELHAILNKSSKPDESQKALDTILEIVSPSKTNKSITPLDRFLETDTLSSNQKREILQLIVDGFARYLVEKMNDPNNFDYSDLTSNTNGYYQEFYSDSSKGSHNHASSQNDQKSQKDGERKPKLKKSLKKELSNATSLNSETSAIVSDKTKRETMKTEANKKVNVNIFLTSNDIITVEYDPILLYCNAKEWKLILPWFGIAKGVFQITDERLSAMIPAMKESGFILTAELLEMMETLQSPFLRQKSQLVRIFYEEVMSSDKSHMLLFKDFKKYCENFVKREEKIKQHGNSKHKEPSSGKTEPNESKKPNRQAKCKKDSEVSKKLSSPGKEIVEMVGESEETRSEPRKLESSRGIDSAHESPASEVKVTAEPGDANQQPLKDKKGGNSKMNTKIQSKQSKDIKDSIGKECKEEIKSGALSSLTSIRTVQETSHQNVVESTVLGQSMGAGLDEANKTDTQVLTSDIKTEIKPSRSTSTEKIQEMLSQCQHEFWFKRWNVGGLFEKHLGISFNKATALEASARFTNTASLQDMREINKILPFSSQDEDK